MNQILFGIGFLIYSCLFHLQGQSLRQYQINSRIQNQYEKYESCATVGNNKVRIRAPKALLEIVVVLPGAQIICNMFGRLCLMHQNCSMMIHFKAPEKTLTLIQIYLKFSDPGDPLLMLVSKGNEWWLVWQMPPFVGNCRRGSTFKLDNRNIVVERKFMIMIRKFHLW